jgi:hypothetical protein
VRSTIGVPRQVERVLHLPRRMIGRDVEGGEVVPVVLDVGTLGPGEAHLAEDRGDLVHHLADRMQRALVLRARRQRDVDLLGGQARGERGTAEQALARVERRFDLALELVDPRAEFLARLGGHAAQGLHQAGDAALLAEHGHARLLERRQVGGLLNGAQRLAAYGRKIVHVSHVPVQTRKKGACGPGSLFMISIRRA